MAGGYQRGGAVLQLLIGSSCNIILWVDVHEYLSPDRSPSAKQSAWLMWL